MNESQNENRDVFPMLSSKKDKSNLFTELIVPIILMSTIGAFYWAIRGSSGFGGTSGGVFAGIGWALAWFFLSYKSLGKNNRPYSSGWIVLAITLGIGIGGMHGYGQFMSWIQGVFYINGPSDVAAIDPAIGFLWLFQCGLIWGGITALFMGWTRSKKPLHFKDWIIRIAFGIVGAIIAFSITIFKPEWIYPLYGQVDYTACTDCARTFSTLQDSMIWIGLFVGLFVYEIFRKDWRNIKLALTMGLGFGLAFSIFAFWHFGPSFSTLSIDWWKNWEISIGFFGGLTFAFCFYFFNRPLQNSELKLITTEPQQLNRNIEKIIGIELAITLALGWSIYNGIGGFVDNFGLNESLILLISIPLILTILIWFIISIVKTAKTPYRVNDGRINLGKPALRFLTIHVILVTLGYLVSLNPSMSFAHWFLIWVYTGLLIVGGIFFIIRIIISKSN